MKILIASANFEMMQTIGSSRPRSFARWLAHYGHEVTVVSRSPREGKLPPQAIPGVEVIRVQASTRISDFAFRVHKSISTILSNPTRKRPRRLGAQEKYPTESRPTRLARFKGALSLFAHVFLDSIWAISAGRVLRRGGEANFDVVISSFGPVASLWLGWRMSAATKSAWISDYRDLLVQDIYPAPVNWVLQCIQDSAVSRADVNIAVSKGLRDALGVRNLSLNHTPAVRLLRNGFDPIDAEQIVDRLKFDDTAGRVLRIGYTGNMYSGRRDARALFDVLGRLRNEADNCNVSIELHYAGRDGKIFRDQAALYGVHGLVTDHGLLSKSEAQRIQSSCDLLLVLSWNSAQQRGILTGKVFEYMRTGKPIIALTGGDLPHSELSELIHDLDLGFAFEYASAADRRPQLEQYLRDAIEKVARGDSLLLDSGGRLTQFHYSNLVSELETICIWALKRRVELGMR